MRFEQMKDKIVKIAVPVVAVIVMVFASRVLVQKLFFTPNSQEVSAAEVSSHKGEDGEHGGGEGSGYGFYMIKDLIINPANSGGRRHLIVTLGLECHSTALEEELAMKDPQIRDNLITLLSGQEIGILADISYREKIRKSLLKAINYYLKEGKVEKLYFVEYVFQ